MNPSDPSPPTLAPAPRPPDYGPPISLADAKRVMAAAEALAERRDWPVVIAIVDSTAHLVLLHKRDQAQLGSVTIAQAKAETAVNFRRPTKAFQDAVAEGGVGLRMVSMPSVSVLEGGLPLFVGGKVVGGIGVSGMQSVQDAEIARAGVAALGSG